MYNFGVWKKNFYNKSEKKLKPILQFANDKNILIVGDNIAKYYALNLNNGELLWSKNNLAPFNSQIKIYKDKFFIIDFSNTLRCFSIKTGKEIWNIKTENSLIRSQKKLSMVIVDDLLYFNNSVGDISAVNIDVNHNNTLLDEENKKLAPLRDKKMESAAKLQKLNLDMSNLVEEENRVKSLQEKLEKSIKTIDSDLERERSISLDADINEKRISREKEELLKTENKLAQVEESSSKVLQVSKSKLEDLQTQLDNMLNKIEKDIDEDKKLTKKIFSELKQLVKKITSSQEEYAENYGKDKSIQSDSIKRKERIKNIDIELENWINLK